MAMMKNIRVKSLVLTPMQERVPKLRIPMGESYSLSHN